MPGTRPCSFGSQHLYTRGCDGHDESSLLHSRLIGLSGQYVANDPGILGLMTTPCSPCPTSWTRCTGWARARILRLSGATRHSDHRLHRDRPLFPLPTWGVSAVHRRVRCTESVGQHLGAGARRSGGRHPGRPGRLSAVQDRLVLFDKEDSRSSPALRDPVA